MAIKVNARETELKIGKKPGYYYVMTPDLYIALAQNSELCVSHSVPRPWQMSTR